MATEKEIFQNIAQRHLAPCLKKSTALVFESGQGSYLVTCEGEKYLDLVQGIAVNQLGHCHPQLQEATISQIKKLGHASFNLGNFPSTLEFAEELSRHTPGDLDMFFFTNSGAEAVESALKLARYVSRKPVIISFRGAFHGRTIGALSVTASSSAYRRYYAPLVSQVYFAQYPYCYRCPFGCQVDSCSLECLEFLKDDLKKIIPPEDVSAVIFEPVQGEGGYVVPPKKYVQALRSLCDEHGFLLIADEIQSGLGRTGRMFAMQHHDVIPDILVMGKALGGGFPMSSVAANTELMAAWVAGTHGTTFGGHPVPAAAGLAQLRIIGQDGFLEEVTAKGKRFRERLNQIRQGCKAIGDVRGLGLMNAVELVDQDGNPDKDLTGKVIKYFFDQKVLVMACGTAGNVIRFMPALNVEEALLDKAADILEESLRKE